MAESLRDDSTLSGWYRDIVDTTGPLRRQFIADLAAKLNAGEFDGQCPCKHNERHDDEHRSGTCTSR